MSATTHFGYRDVPAEEKASLVRGVFDRVSAKYDVMNDLMSLGAHRIWKEILIDTLRPHHGMQLLDLAGGTGDIAFRAMKRARIQVTLADINASMLNEGRNRAVDRNLLTGLTYTCANAEILPFANHSFDACTMAFGLRNVTDILRALAEIQRVLKPGGRFLCLEFSPPSEDWPHDWLRKIYDFYSFRAIPPIGKLVAGDGAPYQYLVESIRKFHTPQALTQAMQTAGFHRVTHRALSGGIVCIHSGWKI